MKKILLSSLIAAAAAVPAFAGVDNINYQAVIKQGNVVLADQKVELKFELLDNSEKVVYTEEQATTTNESGYVACQLGGEGLSTIEWGDLTLRVSIDLGNGYEVLSNEAVSSVPTALYALRSADTDALREEVDAFATMNETRIDKIQTQVDGIDRNFENLGENLDNLYIEIDTRLAQVDGQLENLNNVAAVARANEETLEEVVPAVESLVKDNEETQAKLNSFGADIAQIEGLSEKVEMLEDSMAAIASPSDPESMMNQINAAMGELGEAVEGLVQENEETKSRLNAISADVAQIEGLAKDVEDLNTNTDAFATMVETRFDKVEKLAASNDKSIEALSEQTDAFATMVETRFDKIQGNIDANDKAIEELNGQIESLQNFSNVVKEEYATNESVEDFAGRVGNLIDKVQKQADATDSDITEINAQIESLQNFATVVKEEYATNESVEDFAGRVGNLIDKVQKQADATDSDITEINSKIETLQNFSTVVKEEYATNESVEDFAGRTGNLIDKVQNQADATDKDVEALTGRVEMVEETVQMIADPRNPESIINMMSEKMAEMEAELLEKIAALEAEIKALKGE